MYSLPLKITLTLTNFAILLFLVVLTFNHFSASNNLKSWSLVFYVLCFGWLLLRGIFWLATIFSTTEWAAFDFYILYWVPVPMEFGSFMLVPLFFAHLLNQSLWRDYGSYVRPLYMLFTLGLTLFTIVWALLSAIEERKQFQCEGDADDDIALQQCFHTEYSGWMFRVLTAVCFLFLGVVQGTYGYKLYLLTDWQRLGLLGSKKELMITVSTFISLSFISRVIYQAMVGLDIFVMPDIPLQNDRDVSVLLFLIIQFWDYVPTVLLLATVIRSPSSGSVMSRNRAESNVDNDDADRVPSVVDHFHTHRMMHTATGMGAAGGGQFGGAYRQYGRMPSSDLADGNGRTRPQSIPEEHGVEGAGVMSRIWGLFRGGASEEPQNAPLAAYSADERTRLMVSSRYASTRPPLGKVIADPENKYVSPHLPLPRENSWSSTEHRTGQNAFDDPQQRYWRSGSQTDRDMFATSSRPGRPIDSPLTAGGAEGSGGGSATQPTPLDLRLHRDMSKTKWSSYAPAMPSSGTSPGGQVGVAPSPRPSSGLYGALGHALSSMGDRDHSGGVPVPSNRPSGFSLMSSKPSGMSLMSSPESSNASWNDKASFISSRMGSRPGNAPPPRGLPDNYNPAVNHLQWYYQQQNEQASSGEQGASSPRIPMAYREFSERATRLRSHDAVPSPAREGQLQDQNMYFEDI